MSTRRRDNTGHSKSRSNYVRLEASVHVTRVIKSGAQVKQQESDYKAPCGLAEEGEPTEPTGRCVDMFFVANSSVFITTSDFL